MRYTKRSSFDSQERKAGKEKVPSPRPSALAFEAAQNATDVLARGFNMVATVIGVHDEVCDSASFADKQELTLPWRRGLASPAFR